MNQNDLLKLYEFTEKCLFDFYNEYKHEDSMNNDFDNWNARDVLGHLSWWVRFAGTKLECIKRNNDHSAVTNLLEFNKTTFNSYKNISINIVYQELLIAFDYFKEQMKLYSKEELYSTKLPIGFKFELWKYMQLHLFAHHFMHILPYYLKNKNYKMFVEIIETKQHDLLEFGNIDFFLYKEYIKDIKVLRESMEGLKVFSNKNNIIEKIIEINTI